MPFAGLTSQDFFDSWSTDEGVVSNIELNNWIAHRKGSIEVNINKIPLSACRQWFYDADLGMIRNDAKTFFHIVGLKATRSDGQEIEQPIIIQEEIGYLGILCKRINGTLHFLMQAKIEPGNINAVQLSPTVQATKSNFTRKHNGQAPAYLDYFLNPPPGSSVLDLLQSEQASRFLGKRNRNIIVYVEDNVEILPSHCWMTLGQIARCLEIDNLVNMDTRTVLSCIPYSIMPCGKKGLWPMLLQSAKGINWDSYDQIIRAMNDCKMFDGAERRVVPLNELTTWRLSDSDFSCVNPYPFHVIFCDITIEGREVRNWCQPLFEARGKALFGLLYRIKNCQAEFLVKLTPEVGSLDKVELGPSVQREAFDSEELDAVEIYFHECLVGKHDRIVIDVLQSEEGGRFYYEENRNVIVMLDDVNSTALEGDGYYWCDFLTLSQLCHEGHINIQLRNLIASLGVLFWKNLE